MNEKSSEGSALIEFSLVLSLLVFLFFGLELIWRGYTHRIQAMMIARYISLYTLRHTEIPIPSDIKSKFALEKSDELLIQDPQSSQISFSLVGMGEHLTIPFTLYIWRKKVK